MTGRNPAALAELQARWCDELHGLYEAAGVVGDSDDRVRLLARAEVIERCDMDLRRARRALAGQR